MQLIEFGQRFLNYKALVSIRNYVTGKVEFSGMFVDCPYRFLRFGDIGRIELDNDLNTMIIYVKCNSSMYFDTKSHFLIDSENSP